MKIGRPDDAEAVRFERELDARIAFEAMIGAALIASFGFIALYLAGGTILAVADGSLLTRLPAVAVGALTFGFAVFLGGFAGALAIGVPLFTILERLKLRRGAHYLLGGALANALVFVLLVGRTPLWSEPLEILGLAPGPVIAWLFLRRIAPLWRARPIEFRDTSNVVRLH